jgi:multimeric flavodoxin WrbA
MKVVAFNGSPHKEGNTSILINLVLGELTKEGIETEVVQVGGKKIRGCIACFKCLENLNQRCAVDNDILNGCIEKMLEADGILLGSPVYFTDVTAEMKALIDRAGMVGGVNGYMYKHKVGAAVAAVRRAGSVHTLDTMNHLFQYHQMMVPGSSYWSLGMGMMPGEVEKDEEGVRTMQTLGQNMAWLLKKLHG